MIRLLILIVETTLSAYYIKWNASLEGRGNVNGVSWGSSITAIEKSSFRSMINLDTTSL